MQIDYISKRFMGLPRSATQINYNAKKDLERTIKAIAESRPVSVAKAGWILGQYRRLLFCLFVRSQASCLLARMGHLGEGAKECAARRRVAMAEEERMRREGEAYYSVHIRGRGRWRES